MEGKGRAGSGVEPIEKKLKCPMLACCKVPHTTQLLRHQQNATSTLFSVATAWGKLALVRDNA